ncbi:MAG: sulfur oxidation c-type cytochrome SoxA [Gammaproteobacteria bacterium]|nr:MAG: sulfur oxidation c-type cytochrome SoxA [Gammaproteobacteria bacterium]
MKKAIALGVALFVLVTGTAFAKTNPKEDLKKFQNYYFKNFPNVPKNDFGNGIYALSKSLRDQWDSIEEFPPYELNIDRGEELWNKPFKNGKTHGSCFKNGGLGIKQNYPYFDTKKKTVKTFEQEINECRKANGEKPFKWKKGPITDVMAYLAYSSRGKKINVVIPNDDALKWYERGKKFFYAKRGQLNFSCADCHVKLPGKKIRANLLSTALGQVTHFPIYRSKWGGMGTIHRRYGGCNKQVRAKPFKAQSDSYRALEYFHTYMSNGLPLNGPGARF